MTSEPQNILVIGGAGYIGSHTCKTLSQAGHTPITYDNLSSGHKHAVQWGPLVEGNIHDKEKLTQTIKDYTIQNIIHFAGDIEVGRSTTHPADFYYNNVAGTLSILQAMVSCNVKNIVFSSSAAVYGTPDQSPIPETAPKAPVNPYGQTKHIVELMLQDFANAHGITYAALRYFNACGAHCDGDIGEEHSPETHLIPRALIAITDPAQPLKVFGTDYNTPDGTCIRDYIHVQDLAQAHMDALAYINTMQHSGIFNLGTGKGYSVKEIIQTTARITGKDVPHSNEPRRAGDPPSLVADPTLAQTILGFAPRHSDLDTIIKTAWAFHQSKHA